MGGGDSGTARSAKPACTRGRSRSSVVVPATMVDTRLTQQPHTTQVASQAPSGVQQSCASSQKEAGGKKISPRSGPRKKARNRTRRTRFTDMRIPRRPERCQPLRAARESTVLEVMEMLSAGPGRMASRMFLFQRPLWERSCTSGLAETCQCNRCTTGTDRICWVLGRTAA